MTKKKKIIIAFIIFDSLVVIGLLSTYIYLAYFKENYTQLYQKVYTGKPK